MIRMSSFVVLEGIDGAGGETQSKRLIEFLNKQGKETVTLSYPNPDSPVGKIIYDYLNKNIDLEPDIQMVLYVADFALDREKISDTLKSGKIVVANRYFFSTLAYQCGAKGVSMEKAIQLAKSLKLNVPDLVICIDISPETSIKRKMGEKANLDRHEEDKQLLGKVRKTYQQLAKDGTFAKEWVVIDGESSIEEVADDVQKVVLGKI